MSSDKKSMPKRRNARNAQESPPREPPEPQADKGTASGDKTPSISDAFHAPVRPEGVNRKGNSLARKLSAISQVRMTCSMLLFVRLFVDAFSFSFSPGLL